MWVQVFHEQIKLNIIYFQKSFILSIDQLFWTVVIGGIYFVISFFLFGLIYLFVCNDMLMVEESS